MIQSLRENLSGSVAIILITLIAIPLAFFGVESLFMNSTRISDVAAVNGETISEIELERTVVGQINQLAQMLGPDADPAIFDQERIRPVALNQLIEQKLLLSQARAGNLSVSDQYLAQQVSQIPGFQVAGQFNQVAFRSYLTSMGYSPTTFMQALHDEMIANQIFAGIRSTSFATTADLTRAVEIDGETRSYEYLIVPRSVVTAAIEVNEADIASYYEANRENFREPERVVLDYISLTPDVYLQAPADIPGLSDRVLQRFNDLKALTPDRKRVSHILLEGTGVEQVATEIEQINARLAAGEEFSALAAEFSADLGSANSGGDLGYTAGATFPVAFEAAVAALAVGEVSPPVVTEAGVHIIQVTDQAASDFSLESQYAAIELEIRREIARDTYLDAVTEVQGLAFSSENLPELMERYEASDGLAIQTSAPFSRELGTGIAADGRVRSVAFGPNVLTERFIEVIEVNDSETLLVQLREHIPTRVPELADLSESIANVLREQGARESLIAQADLYRAELEQGLAMEELADRQGYVWQAAFDTRRDQAGVIGPLVFNATLDQGIPVLGGDVAADGDYYLFRLTEARSGATLDYANEQLRQYSEAIAMDRSAMEWAAYLDSVRADANIDIKVRSLALD